MQTTTKTYRKKSGFSPRIHHTFGPVPSRRLGRSLGLDLVPYKTCTYDCIYCQCGRTTCKTAERKEWVPLDEVLEDVKQQLPCRPDYITLSGAGEPTLYSRLGDLIDELRAMTKKPVAVLTNGSLLWDPEVRKQLRHASVVLPSLDAMDPLHFQAINRPVAAISFERMIDGLMQFRQEFDGQYWLEIMLLAGYTSLPTAVQKLARCVELIQPDRVQLNTVSRPPTEDYALAVSPEQLEEFAKAFEPHGEVIADYRGKRNRVAPAASRQAILDLLQRRPCTLEDVSRGLGIRETQAAEVLDELELRRLVFVGTHADRIFYQADAQKVNVS